MDNNHSKSPLSGKKIAMFVLYAIIAVFLFITVLSFNDIDEIIAQLKNADFKYILCAAGTTLVYLALYPLSLCILARAKQCRAKSSVTYSIAMTEHFFNGITPLATGGQPFQAHQFSRAKVKLADSTGLLLANLLIYMLVTTGFSLTGLFFFDELTAYIDKGWIPIIIIGYSLNFSVLVIEIILGTSKTVRKWIVKFIYWLCKFRMFKKLEPKAEEFAVYLEQVQDAFKLLIRKKKYFITAIITKILSFAFLYASSYFILLALNVKIEPYFFLALCGTSFAITGVGFIPTPGGSGAVEGSTAQVFKSIIMWVSGGTVIVSGAAAIAGGVMMIWRLLSYYMVMLISLGFYIGLEIYFKKRKNAEIAEESTENITEE